jgi:HD-like signal output (HDOD) protein/ActR/RegA family two-component response regulator
MEKKRVLFVDDEPNILDGLRRMLRGLRHQYDMDFASGGREALELMATVRFDMVISDMRMPGMDGAELFERIQKDYPHTIRIMLSGQADEQAILRTVGVVHQFLAKPCDPEVLKAILVKSAALQDILGDGSLKNIISQIDSLPSLPAVYDKLSKAISADDFDINHIGAIIEEDVAMSAKVLQLVNSAFFGIYTKVNSPTRAVQLLGLDTVKVLVLGLGIFQQVKIPHNVFCLDDLWHHSLAVGKIAKAIAIEESSDQEVIGDSFLAGTMHDIGKLILVSQFPDQYLEAMRRAREQQLFLVEVEERFFGVRQGAVGGYLLGLWGFSNSVIEAICFQPALRQYPAKSFSPALAVHVANVLYYQQNPEEVVGKQMQLNMEIIEFLGLRDRVPLWTELCASSLHSMKQDSTG